MDVAKLGLMPPCLRVIHDECRELERAHSGWAGKPFYSAWQNYLPSPDRLSLFLLGLNVGGRPATGCDGMNASESWNPEFSACLDEKWDCTSAPGQSKPQRRMRRVFDALAGGSGDALLRRVPGGNIVPFRTQNATDLFANAAIMQAGTDLGLRVLRLVKSSVIVCFGNRLTASRKNGSTLAILLNHRPESWDTLSRVERDADPKGSADRLPNRWF